MPSIVKPTSGICPCTVMQVERSIKESLHFSLMGEWTNAVDSKLIADIDVPSYAVVRLILFAR